MPSLRRNAAMTQPPLIPIADYDEPGPARELREAWLARRRLLVTLTDRCAVPMIVGRVACVSVTGATSVIDGWTIPTAEIESIVPATNDDADAYADLMHALRQETRS
jgi:hypothetical protein